MIATKMPTNGLTSTETIKIRSRLTTEAITVPAATVPTSSLRANRPMTGLTMNWTTNVTM